MACKFPQLIELRLVSFDAFVAAFTGMNTSATEHERNPEKVQALIPARSLNAFLADAYRFAKTRLRAEDRLRDWQDIAKRLRKHDVELRHRADYIRKGLYWIEKAVRPPLSEEQSLMHDLDVEEAFHLLEEAHADIGFWLSWHSVSLKPQYRTPLQKAHRMIHSDHPFLMEIEANVERRMNRSVELDYTFVYSLHERLDRCVEAIQETAKFEIISAVFKCAFNRTYTPENANRAYQRAQARKYPVWT